jgi:hypothetical protein
MSGPQEISTKAEAAAPSSGEPDPDHQDDEQGSHADGSASESDLGKVALISRNDLDMRVSYPEPHGIGDAIPGTQLLLDGEIVVRLVK